MLHKRLQAGPASSPDVVFFVSSPNYMAQSGAIGDYLSVAKFAQDTGLTARAVSFSAANATILFDNDRLLLWDDLDEPIDLVRARAFVWFPVSFEPEHLVLRASTPGELAGYENRQWRVVTAYLEQRLSRIAPCINDPNAARLASNKLIQQEEAIALGLPVLSTVTTSRVDLALGGKGGKWNVAKNLSEGDAQAFLVHEGTSTGSIAHLVGPTIIQPFVEAVREIRIYVFGDESLAVESPFERPINEGDNVRNRPGKYKFCDDLSWLYPKLRAWLNRLNLRYAAVDCLEHAGEISILEANPNGTWHWLPPPIALEVGGAFRRLVVASVCTR